MNMEFLTHHLLQVTAQRQAEREALVCGDRRLSYGQVWQQACRLAAALQRLGLQRGDRLGILLPPSIPQAISIFASSCADGVFVPVHHSLFPDQVVHIVNDCQMKGLVIDRAKLLALGDRWGEMPSLQFLIVVDHAPQRQVPLPCHDYADCIRAPASTVVASSSIGQDLAAILYTSGSTGRAKGVMLSHANLLAGASIVSEYLEITGQDRTLSVLPFSFDAGLNQIMTTFQQGGTLILLRFLFPADICRVLKDEQITALAGVPTLWSRLADSPSFQNGRFPSLRYITSTGGVMPQHVLRQLRSTLDGTKIYLMYGLTEAFRSTYLPPEELDRRPNSIGRAVPNTEILVVDDLGRRCGPGEVGELVHRGPTVALGYWGQPELTAQVFRPDPCPLPGVCDGPRVCYSGDLVTMDDEGYLYFVGRRDNLIKSSGFRISPTEIEAALCRTGVLQQAAVVGIPNETLGHTICAFVVPARRQQVEIEALLRHCRQRLPAYMIPHRIHLVDQLPGTSSGKIDYPALRQQAVMASCDCEAESLAVEGPPTGATAPCPVKEMPR